MGYMLINEMHLKTLIVFYKNVCKYVYGGLLKSMDLNDDGQLFRIWVQGKENTHSVRL